MTRLVVALNGPIASGKSSLSRELVHLGWGHASTSAYLRTICPADADRGHLLAAGATLDRRTPTWLRGLLFGDLVVVDAVRSHDQLRVLSDTPGTRVLLVHLTANPSDLSARRSLRGDPGAPAEGVGPAWGVDGEGENLVGYATLTLDTTGVDPRTAAALVHRLATGRTGPERGYADAVVGGQYGSEGKGHVVSRIAGGYDVLVRSGGPNAGHRVFLGGDRGPGGAPTYCYHHLPSGTMHNPRAVVAIAAGATIWLPRFREEVADCNAWGRLVVDPNVVVIEQDDRRAEEALVGAIGSTAQGVGVATSRRVLRGLGGRVRTAADVPELSDLVTPVSGYLESAVTRGQRVLLEGTQGSGLSLYHGPYPHCTSRDTNVAGLLSECGVAPALLRRVLAVCRTNPIRVAGNSGPMEGELTWEDVAPRAGVDALDLRERERTSTTNRLRRVAEFDWGLFSRMVVLNRPTDLALTFTDYHHPGNARARSVGDLVPETRAMMAGMSERARARVSLVSTGFGDPGETVLTDGSWP